VFFATLSDSTDRHTVGRTLALGENTVRSRTVNSVRPVLPPLPRWGAA